MTIESPPTPQPQCGGSSRLLHRDNHLGMPDPIGIRAAHHVITALEALDGLHTGWGQNRRAGGEALPRLGRCALFVIQNDAIPRVADGIAVRDSRRTGRRQIRECDLHV